MVNRHRLYRRTCCGQWPVYGNLIGTVSMLLNHVVLPLYQTIYQSGESARVQMNIYRWLTNVKRLIIASLVLACYGFYRLLHHEVDMYSLSIVAYVGALQLLPGTLSTLYGAGANHKGLILGILSGTAVWFFTLMLPLTMGLEIFPIRNVNFGTITNDGWYLAATASLVVNVLVFCLSPVLPKCPMKSAARRLPVWFVRCASSRSKSPRPALLTNFRRCSVPLWGL